MYTRGQIVEEMQNRGVEFSERAFIYLQENDMLPKVSAYEGRLGLFPPETLHIVNGIMKAREAGRSKKSIKAGLDIMKGSKEIRLEDENLTFKLKGWWPVENYLLLSVSCPEKETISFFLMDGATIPPEEGIEESPDVLFRRSYGYHEFSVRAKDLTDSVLFEEGRLPTEDDFVKTVFEDIIERSY